MLMVFSPVGGAARHRFVCWSVLIAVSRHRAGARVVMDRGPVSGAGM
jgi:hypothetical protein